MTSGREGTSSTGPAAVGSRHCLGESIAADPKREAVLKTGRPADEQEWQLRTQARELASQWAADGRYQPRCDSWARSFDHAFSRELSRRGLIGMAWPVSVGGRGLSHVLRLAVTEELLRAGAPVAAHWFGDRQIGPAILRCGSPDLQAEILPGIVSSDFLFCLGMSESEAGSDLASVSTSAAKVAGGWRISGRKIWTSNAHLATHAYLLARTSRHARKHGGLTEFIVDMNWPGIEVSPILDMTGGHHFNEVQLDDVFVPDERVLGVVGEGWRQVVNQLSFERGGPERVLSTYPLLAELLDKANATPDAPLAHDIGDLAARLAVLRSMCRAVAEAVDTGRAPIQESATLKYLGNQFERDVILVARRWIGTEDCGPESCVGQALLASPSFSIRGGAADVLLALIARHDASAGARGRP